MNKARKIYCLIIILLVWNFTGIHMLYSQLPYDSSFNQEAKEIKENITLFTDRDMYAVNERISFRALYSCKRPTGMQPWSKVLYLELVSPKGQSLARGKYHLDENGSSGYLTIPSDVLTGNYYLRTYTRWMRNFGPSAYGYVQLTIINPYREEVLTETKGYQSEYPEFSQLKTPVIKCKSNKEIYAQEGEVSFEIINVGPENNMVGEYCISVVPVGLIDTNYYPDAGVNPGEGRDFQFNYLPDIYGVSISGRVLNTEDQSSAGDIRLHFSCLDGKADYFATQTDEQGRFIQTIPDRTGIQELFVVPEQSGDTKLEILIDQDFAAGAVPYKSNPFTLTAEEKEAAKRMVLNMQLTKAYGSGEIKTVAGRESDSLFRFYGKPDITVIIDDFVNLPTMEEVFLNLVPNVFISYKRREPYLRIESLNNSISLFPPLILVDNIPVFDLKSIMGIDPAKIEKIEVINEVYVKGDLRYGGIINISSIKNDMAAVDLPEGSYFFDYQTFHPGDSKAMPPRAQNSGLISGKDQDRIPDSRNTIEWMDRIRPGSDGKISLHFSAPANPGEYQILVRALSSDGDIIHGTGSFQVKQK